MACRPAGAASGRKSADAAHRRRGAAAPRAALGQHRQAVPVRHRRGAVEYNFRVTDLRPPAGEETSRNAWAEAIVSTDWETYRREGPGMSAFALEDGVVYHTYTAYERGLDAIWGMYQWLDRAPLGRNETGHWWRRHDEYDSE